MYDRVIPCETCQGTRQAVVEIEKEWVECPECSQAPESFTSYNCKTCKNQGKIQKYKVGQEIEKERFISIIGGRRVYDKIQFGKAIQKSVEKAEKRIDEEFKENYSANGCKIVAKQIIRDVFGEGKNDK